MITMTSDKGSLSQLYNSAIQNKHVT